MAAQTERAGRISQECAARLIDAGFFNICMPVAAGGYGYEPSMLWRVAREVGRGCASSGWILGLVGISPWLVGMFEPDAQRAVFAAGNPIVPIMTGGMPSGLSVRLERGLYVLSGQWRYASGIDASRWAVVMAPAPKAEGDVDHPSPRLFLVPTAEFSIDPDTWDVLGMRGTGSKSVRLNGTRVPAAYTIDWVEAQKGSFPGREVHQDPSYRMPLNPFFAMSVAAPIMGAASGALDASLESLRARVRPNGGSAQKEEQFVHVEVGQAATVVEMAFLSFIAQSDRMYEMALANEPFTPEIRAGLRAHTAAAASAALGACQRLFRLAGGHVLQRDTALERSFRDLHAMTTHFLVQPDVSAELYGRVRLGLDLPANARI